MSTLLSPSLAVSTSSALLQQGNKVHLEKSSSCLLCVCLGAMCLFTVLCLKLANKTERIADIIMLALSLAHRLPPCTPLSHDSVLPGLVPTVPAAVPYVLLICQPLLSASSGP